MQIFHRQALFRCSINIYAREDVGLSPLSLSLSLSLSLRDNHGGSVFTNEDQKQVDRDVYDTSATQSCLVHDVNDIDWHWAHTAALSRIHESDWTMWTRSGMSTRGAIQIMPTGPVLRLRLSPLKLLQDARNAKR